MIKIDCTITHYYQRTGVLGDGTPTFGESALSHALPCMVVPFTIAKQASLEAMDVSADAVIKVAQSALKTTIPTVHDRVRYTAKADKVSREAEVVDAKAHQGGLVWELILKDVADGRTPEVTP